MALMAVEGVYRDGKVELEEQPAGIREARVMVVFLPEEPAPALDPEVRERRRQRAFAQMREGINLGGPPYPKREEPYERSSVPASDIPS